MARKQTQKNLDRQDTRDRLNKSTSAVFGKVSAIKGAFVTEYTKDFNHRRAAETLGRSSEWALRMLNDDDEVRHCIECVMLDRANDSKINAEWVLHEAVDNHRIARQCGNLTASNKALDIIAKHKMIDAMASAQINVNVAVDDQVRQRLADGRKRAAIDITSSGEAVIVGELDDALTPSDIEKRRSVDPVEPDPIIPPASVSFF